MLCQLLVFSVTLFKIDQNKNQNRSTDKVKNVGNERRYIYKDPRQHSGQRNISYTIYPKKCFTQTYREFMEICMETPCWCSRPTLNSIRQTDVDTLMIRTQSRVRVRVRVWVRVRVIYLNQTSFRHQILGGVGVRVMHPRSDAPSSNPTLSILNCFFP